MMYVLFVILTFVISAAIGWFAIPRIVIIAKMKRLFDETNARKVHKGAVPRLGGLSFFPAALFSFAFVLGLRYYYGYDVALDLQVELLTEFLFVMAGMLILYFVGMADDLIGVGYRNKFVAQFFAGICLVFAGVTVFDLQGLFGVHRLPFALDAVLTVVAVVLTVNAFNLIDGVDGLCSGLGTIILTTLGILFIYYQLFVYAMFAFGMVGVLIAFFQYNVLGTRLKVFMGDTGSLTLGYMIIFLGLKFINLENTTFISVGFNSTLAILAGMLFLPVFDTCRVFVSRISRDRSPFFPDKSHVHHKLLRLNRTHLQSTGILLLMEIGFVLLNFVLAEFLGLDINWVLLADILLGVGFNVVLNKLIDRYGRELDEHEVMQKP
ncbi:MraY family glycosyltransferase [uncultured Rikenella sp.]|uniref:MraY family glycosyltransferase n=1 Tax=uncultured Rikenella sp. TaxID=368003 RepID=UPI00260C39CE|nr:MraY family glycosyltransferase [uncultured Rikenella sp.]